MSSPRLRDARGSSYISDMRARVRGAVACPVCEAPIGEPCFGPLGPRKSHHTARNDLFAGRELRLPLHPEAKGAAEAGAELEGAEPAGDDTPPWTV